MCFLAGLRSAVSETRVSAPRPRGSVGEALGGLSARREMRLQ